MALKSLISVPDNSKKALNKAKFQRIVNLNYVNNIEDLANTKAPCMSTIVHRNKSQASKTSCIGLSHREWS